MPKFSLGDYMDIIKVNGVAVEPSMIGHIGILAYRNNNWIGQELKTITQTILNSFLNSII